jgi:hypothetical protein
MLPLQTDDDDEYPFDDQSLWQDQDGDTATDIIDAMGNQYEHIVHSLQLVTQDGLSCLAASKPQVAKCSRLSNLLHQSTNF